MFGSNGNVIILTTENQLVELLGECFTANKPMYVGTDGTLGSENIDLIEKVSVLKHLENLKSEWSLDATVYFNEPINIEQNGKVYETKELSYRVASHHTGHAFIHNTVFPVGCGLNLGILNRIVAEDSYLLTLETEDIIVKSIVISGIAENTAIKRKNKHNNILNVVNREDLFATVAEKSRQMQEEFQQRFQQHYPTHQPGPIQTHCRGFNHYQPNPYGHGTSVYQADNGSVVYTGAMERPLKPADVNSFAVNPNDVPKTPDVTSES